MLDRFYRGVPNLVLLHIDESLLTAPLVVEQLGDAPEPFPHLYGPLNIDAVVHVDDPMAQLLRTSSAPTGSGCRSRRSSVSRGGRRGRRADRR